MQNRRSPSHLLVCLLAAGCASDAPSDLEPILEGKADAPVILSGNFVSNLVPVSDGCGLGVEMNEPEFSEVRRSDDGLSFEFVADGMDADCVMSETGDGSFECEIASPMSEFLPVSMTMQGIWLSSDRFEADFTVAVDCEGEDCESESLNEAFGEATELPCATVGEVTVTRAMPFEWTTTEGLYAVTSEPIEGLSTCASDPFGALPAEVGVATTGTGFSIDDGFAAFDCDVFGGGGFTCERTVALQGLEFDTFAAGAFVSQNQVEGVMQVTVTCTAEDAAECEELEEIFGAFPCRSYRTVGLELSEL